MHNHAGAVGMAKAQFLLEIEHRQTLVPTRFAWRAASNANGDRCDQPDDWEMQRGRFNTVRPRFASPQCVEHRDSSAST
jgi:hypothetical protein